MKILCLHGLQQNAQIFRRRTGALRKELCTTKKHIYDSNHDDNGIMNRDVREENREDEIEMIYIDGLFQASDKTRTENQKIETDNENVIGRSWWKDTDSESDEGGWNETLKYLRECFRTHGPIHGLLGFSQGAAVGALIAGIREDYSEFHSLSFIILISGYMSRAKCHEHIWNKKKICIPVLNVYGGKDQLLPMKLSKELERRFEDEYNWRLVHDGGHIVPGGKRDRMFVKEFVNRFWKGKNEVSMVNRL